MVHADPLRLRQVLINLLSNAVKFTERGCIGINVYPTAMNAYARTPYNEGGYAIQVFDTGVGISSEFLEKVFEPFTQEERSYCNTQRGTGLGLSITRELVQRMGGTISVESQLDQGSIFTVYLAAGAGTGRTIAQAA